MEFLMTYGWAILAAIIAIGVLAYFGVFNPDRLAGSTAVVNSPFFIDNFNIDGALAGNNDVVNIEIIQNSGESVTVAIGDLDITGTGPSQGYDCSNAGAVTLVSGVRQAIAVLCGDTALIAGDQYVGNIQIAYTKGTSTLSQISTGNIRGTAQ